MYLLGKTLEELRAVAERLHMPRFAAKQMAEWLYGKHVTDIDEMTNISKAHRSLLKEHYAVGAQDEPLSTLRSVDGTEKYLFETISGKRVETVMIPSRNVSAQSERELLWDVDADGGGSKGERRTLCVSTQVGCKMNCLFCQTGKQGFEGNLLVADILSQISWAMRNGGLDNIVLMGQGEPLDNLAAVLRVIEIMTADYGYAWSPYRITVSTVGLRTGLKRLLDETKCHVAISLHSPVHEGRLSLMPAEKQMSVHEIVELLREYDFSHQRRLSFEYMMLKGRNDTIHDADLLLKLLRGLDCRVNLLRWHKIDGVKLESSDEQTMIAFRNHLTKHGIYSTIRASRGEDIMAACGMLTSKEKGK